MKKLILILILAALAPLHADTLVYTIRSGTANTPKERSVTLTPGTTLRVGSGTLAVVSDADFRTALKIWETLPSTVAWSDISAGGKFVWPGSDNSTVYVDSSSSAAVTIHNASAVDLYLTDTNENNFQTIQAGSTVEFEASDLGGGDVSFSENARFQPQPHNSILDDLADGSLSGSLVQAAGTGNAGAVNTTTQSFSGNKTFTGNIALGDASGDTLSIAAASPTAPNATAVGSTNLANVGALDTRYPRRILAIQTSDQTSGTTALTNSQMSAVLASGTYVFTANIHFSVTSTTAGIQGQIVTFNSDKIISSNIGTIGSGVTGTSLLVRQATGSGSGNSFVSAAIDGGYPGLVNGSGVQFTSQGLIIVATGTTYTYQFGQRSTSDGSNLLTLKANSYIHFLRQ